MSDWPADLAILIPVYNHGATVGAVVAGALALGAAVLVVDDGSTDDSGEAARAAGAQLISHKQNHGKALALLTGMTRAWQLGFARVCTVDADGQHPIDETPRLKTVSQQYPDCIVIGQRDMSVAPLLNRIGRFWSNCSVWSTCGRWPGDSQSGLRIYPLESVLRLPLKANHYAFEIEVLTRASWAGIGLRPLPVRVLYPRDRITHFDKLRDNWRAFRSWAYLLLRSCWPQAQRLQELPERV